MKSMYRVVLCMGASLLIAGTGAEATPEPEAAEAQGLQGTWRFEKTAEFHPGINKARPAPPETLHATESKLFLAANCVVGVKGQPYYPGGPFQSLLQGVADEAAIGAWTSKTLGVPISGQKTFYEVELDRARCNRIADSILVRGDRLVGIYGDGRFVSYRRVAPPPRVPDPLAVFMAGIALSQLPFDVDAHIALCPVHPGRDGKLAGGGACAPIYMPQVAGKADARPLSKLVGLHRYARGGARNATADYDAPATQGLHPVFLAFPPMGDVIVVRVDDFEGGDRRESMSGAYLSIRNGAVVDQLNEGCALDEHFRCVGVAGEGSFQLMPSGKFERVQGE